MKKYKIEYVTDDFRKESLTYDKLEDAKEIYDTISVISGVAIIQLIEVKQIAIKTINKEGK